jgi:hypothetical protein
MARRAVKASVPKLEAAVLSVAVVMETSALAAIGFLP